MLDDVPVTEAGLVSALCRVRPHVVAHSLTAARLWGFPLPRRHQEWSLGDPVAVLVGSAARGDRRGHYLRRRGSVAPEDITDVGADRTRSGIPLRLTSRSRTWADLWPTLTHDELVVIGDYLVRRPRPVFEGRNQAFCTLEHLRGAARQKRSERRESLTQVLADVRVGSDSPRETALRLACLRAGLPEPELNARWIVDGTDLSTPDLLWRGAKVCAEYEGAPHLDLQQMRRDEQRRERRTAAGAREVRIFHGDLEPDPRVATGKIQNALHAAAVRSAT